MSKKKIKIDATGRRLGQQGTKAWKKIKQTNIESYEVWMQLAESFQSGRSWAMAEAKTNKPKGSGYNRQMGDWLYEFELTDVDPSDRARLLNYLEHRDEIEAYFTGIELDFKAYHPATLFKKWKAATQPKKPRQPKAETPAFETKPATAPKKWTADDIIDLVEELPVRSQEAVAVELKRIKPEIFETTVKPDASKNPLTGFDAGQIVDFILGLKVSTVKAILHDLVRETVKKPELEADPAPLKSKPVKSKPTGEKAAKSPFEAHCMSNEPGAFERKFAAEHEAKMKAKLKNPTLEWKDLGGTHEAEVKPGTK
jgi:hypothetical protein